MEVSKPGFVYVRTSKYASKYEVAWFNFEMKDDKDFALIGPCSLKFEMPDDFDLNGKKIEALKAEKQKAMADFQKLVTDIDRQISELTAIEFDGEGV